MSISQQKPLDDTLEQRPAAERRSEIDEANHRFAVSTDKPTQILNGLSDTKAELRIEFATRTLIDFLLSTSKRKST